VSGLRGVPLTAAELEVELEERRLSLHQQLAVQQALDLVAEYDELRRREDKLLVMLEQAAAVVDREVSPCTLDSLLEGVE